jgi:branched-chain amino acid transport system substrate-binding protein
MGEDTAVNKIVSRFGSGLVALSLVLGAAGCGGSSGSKEAGGSQPAPAVKVRGITKEKVIVGAFQPLQGPLAAEAKQVAEGVKAYFAHINEKGGVNGRKIEYKVENDNYNPQQAVAATKKLVDRDEIFALVAPLGTATGMAVLPYVKEQKLPLIGALAGTPELLDSKEPSVFGIMPTSQVNGAATAKYAIEALKPKKAAIFFQNDAFGKGGKDGIEAALKEAKVEIVDIAGYQTTDTDLSSMVVKMKNANPDTVFLYAVPKFAAMFLTEAKKLGWKPNLIGANPIAHPDTGKLAGDAANGLKMTIFTALGDSADKKVQEMVAILKKHSPETPAGYYAFNGMASAAIFAEALKKAGANPTTDALLKSLESIQNFDIGLVPPISYAAGKHGGATRYAVAEWQNGKMVIIKPW